MRKEPLSKKDIRRIKRFTKKYPNYLAYVDMDLPKKKKARNK
tara:strand:+ start:531 stop:656 length:126 start_codon:yes stop_codon:yes gene_type:complete